MMKRATILLLSLFFAFIVLLIFTVQEWQREEQAEWMPKVEFQGDALSDAEKNDIKEAVMGEIIPYKLEYDHINISVKKNNGYYEIEVFCFSDECEYPDVYDFSYDGNLVLNGYILEAIPPSERAKAISVALQNEGSCEFGVCKRLGRGDTLSKKNSSRNRSEILCGEDDA
ncbi:MAG: hypothetical protein MW690_001338 [Methanophagales archaeon]|nr:hypothetical protein [Methanophagales archaeon]MCU4139406.1 hypothetical protein [Methanophagales archaeon]